MPVSPLGGVVEVLVVHEASSPHNVRHLLQQNPVVPLNGRQALSLELKTRQWTHVNL